MMLTSHFSLVSECQEQESKSVFAGVSRLMEDKCWLKEVRCVSGWNRLVAGAIYSKERAVPGQVDKLGEVASYCKVNCCIRWWCELHPMARRYLSTVEDVVQCFASVA
jgi:hypothetical protein